MRFDAKMQGRVIFVVALMLSLCFPALSSADADKIFKENSKAVVVVIAYYQQCVDVADQMQICYAVV